MMTMGDMIDVQDLPPYMHAHSEDSANVAPVLSTDIGTLEEQERLLLIRALEAAAGNQSKAARLLRIGRDALRYKLKKHNLDTPDSGKLSAAAG
jgi:DNA-binding NtrC family response regulator